MSHSFIQSCPWITLQVLHHQWRKTCAEKWNVKLIFRGPWNSLWIDLIDPDPLPPGPVFRDRSTPLLVNPALRVCSACGSYLMSGVAAWSLLTGTPFVDVLNSTVADHPDSLHLYLQTATGRGPGAGGKWAPAACARTCRAWRKLWRHRAGFLSRGTRRESLNSLPYLKLFTLPSVLRGRWSSDRKGIWDSSYFMNFVIILNFISLLTWC